MILKLNFDKRFISVFFIHDMDTNSDAFLLFFKTSLNFEGKLLTMLMIKVI